MALPLLEVLHATRPRDVSIAGRLAWAQLQLDKKLACAQTLARGLAVDPEDSLLLTIKAQLFIAQKQFDLSEAVFHRLIALHPTSSTAQFAWAYYLETRGRREEAVKAVREAFHVDPQLGQKLAPRMEVRTQPGIVSVLLPQLQLLDRAGLHLPWVPIQLTRAYLLTGAKEKALATAREGVRLHPRDPLVARNYLEQLEKLGKVDEMLQFLQTAPKDVAISLGKRKWR
jgi:tetratricopeptide (TPR) repeat protein